MRNEVEIVDALTAVECIVAVYVREPLLADPEFADVSLYVEVRPFTDSAIAAVREALIPVVGIDGVVGTHVQSADHPHRAMLVGARKIFDRGTE